MDSFKVAMLQLMPCGDIDENLEKGVAACRRAKLMDADLAIFPEMWSVGYEIPETADALHDSAVSADGGFVTAFAAIAKELDMAIGITFLEEHTPSPRNTLCIFDRFGNKILHYAKVHTCDFGDECRLDAGDDFYTAELDTAHGCVKIGAMICYDREFPESARILMLKGAEIILVPNACPMEINRISQLRARAYENMVGIATVNYPYGKPDCNGHSTAFDGIAYREGDGESRDTLILDAGEREGVYIADFPIAALREYRRTEVHGNAYRRPERYSAIVEKSKQEPFVRSDFKNRG